MGKSLIIAEKPSLARNICAALSAPSKWVSFDSKTKTGYYDNGKTIVTSAFGHLLELKDAEDYNPAFKAWDVDALPIIPDTFEYKIRGDSGVSAQLRMLKTLVNDPNIDKVVNAGDSDREGEIIVRNILAFTGNKKPVYRLWMPDQTKETIRQELMSMKEDSEYDSLANEGWARTYIDWLYGINLTRLATRKSGSLLRVGRVTSPIVAAICERERAIRNFVPENYYVSEHCENGLRLTSKKKHPSKDDCAALCDHYNTLETTVTSRETKDVVIPRPKLYALSDLQGAAGKQFKFTPKATLDTLQKLYEAGYVSYPRTNSQYMAVAEKQKAAGIVRAMQEAMPGTFAGIQFRDSKYIFDDSKIEAHSAITPTHKIPHISELPLDQQKIYSLIMRRFAAAFCKEDFKVSRTTLTVTNGEETFTVKGDIILSKGFTVFEKSEKKNDVIPDLKEGDKIVPAFKPLEKETEPPRHYTADTLNAYLKNPFSKEERKEITEDDGAAEEVLSDIELGTEATRAGLIDAAIKSGYITLTKNVYGITALGEYYCDSLARLGIDMTKAMTLELGKSLKLVYRSQKTVGATVSDAKSDLSSIVAQAKKVPEMEAPKGAPRHQPSAEPEEDPDIGASPVTGVSLGICPSCKKNIYAYPNSWRCENPECPRRIFRNEKLFVTLKSEITDEIAAALLIKGKCPVKGMISRKTGKPFDAIIHLRFSGGRRDFKFEFEKKPQENKAAKASQPAKGASGAAPAKSGSAASRTASK